MSQNELWARLRHWYRRQHLDLSRDDSKKGCVVNRVSRGASYHSSDVTLEAKQIGGLISYADGQQVEGSFGSCWRLTVPLSRFYRQIEGRLPSGLARAGTARCSDGQEAVQKLSSTIVKGALFFDIETSGLYGSMVFLVGLLRWSTDGWRLTQFLARNPGEEKALLEQAWRYIYEAALLVSFNGKAFDWPTLRDRTLRWFGLDYPRRFKRTGSTTAHGEPGELAHIDLLHLSRRLWRGCLPDFRLQTLELAICQRRRVGDIPGQYIPWVYDQFVQRGRTDLIDRVLLHNALDLLTCVEVALAICRQHAPG